MKINFICGNLKSNYLKWKIDKKIYNKRKILFVEN